MKTSKVKNENYVVIQGFMVNQLKLKGNELMVYAIIYGFSQEENQRFTGSLQYLADWTNSTRQGVVKNLKSLLEKGFIGKEDKIINGVKFCEYYTTEFNGVYNSVVQGVQQSLTPIQQSLTGGVQLSCNNNISINNKDNNIVDKIEDNIEVTPVETSLIEPSKFNSNNYEIIIDYLNSKAGTNYRYSSAKTQSLIKARFNEGYTLDDFKLVINKKVSEWISDNKMRIYLRPETLFGSKFEGYLNQPSKEVTTKDLTPYTDFSDFYNDLEGDK